MSAGVRNIEIMQNNALKSWVDFIQETVGPQSELIPSEAHLTLRDQDIKSFIENMLADEQNLFKIAILNFQHYMNALNPVRKNKHRPEAWTNFVLIVLFGLIEQVVHDKYEDCYNYVKKNIKKCVDEGGTEEVLEEWRKAYGANLKVRNFFKEYISDEEKEHIIYILKQNPKFKKITSSEDPIKKFIGWIIECRGYFVHGLSRNAIDESNLSVQLKNEAEDEFKNEDFVWHPTLSIGQLIKFVLLGVFRRFDKGKELSIYYE